MATFNKFNSFVQDLATGVHNMATGTSHTFKIALTNTAPGSGNTVLGNISQIAGNNGYTTGGATCNTVVGAQTNGTFKLSFSGADPVWTGATGPMGPFQYCVLYNDTPSTPTDPLIGWWDYGSPVTLQIGETFTVDLDETNGVLTVA